MYKAQQDKILLRWEKEGNAYQKNSAKDVAKLNEHTAKERKRFKKLFNDLDANREKLKGWFLSGKYEHCLGRPAPMKMDYKVVGADGQETLASRFGKFAEPQDGIPIDKLPGLNVSVRHPDAVALILKIKKLPAPRAPGQPKRGQFYRDAKLYHGLQAEVEAEHMKADRRAAMVEKYRLVLKFGDISRAIIKGCGNVAKKLPMAAAEGINNAMAGTREEWKKGIYNAPFKVGKVGGKLIEMTVNSVVESTANLMLGPLVKQMNDKRAVDINASFVKDMRSVGKGLITLAGLPPDGDPKSEDFDGTVHGRRKYLEAVRRQRGEYQNAFKVAAGVNEQVKAMGKAGLDVLNVVGAASGGAAAVKAARKGVEASIKAFATQRAAQQAQFRAGQANAAMAKEVLARSKVGALATGEAGEEAVKTAKRVLRQQEEVATAARKVAELERLGKTGTRQYAAARKTLDRAGRGSADVPDSFDLLAQSKSASKAASKPVVSDVSGDFFSASKSRPASVAQAGKQAAGQVRRPPGAQAAPGAQVVMTGKKIDARMWKASGGASAKRLTVGKKLGAGQMGDVYATNNPRLVVKRFNPKQGSAENWAASAKRTAHRELQGAKLLDRTGVDYVRKRGTFVDKHGHPHHIIERIGKKEVMGDVLLAKHGGRMTRGQQIAVMDYVRKINARNVILADLKMDNIAFRRIGRTGDNWSVRLVDTDFIVDGRAFGVRAAKARTTQIGQMLGTSGDANMMAVGGGSRGGFKKLLDPDLVDMYLKNPKAIRDLAAKTSPKAVMYAATTMARAKVARDQRRRSQSEEARERQAKALVQVNVDFGDSEVIHNILGFTPAKKKKKTPAKVRAPEYQFD